ncbi:MAG: SDR family NAD(P)-dependent oxidoreductase [Lachnospiraceae bacterium]|jgi:short-subunit dehydrogenase|nr:SDR family NAD(P)-dependent oxidoreductase [Lachnospiraceae bacterium]
MKIALVTGASSGLGREFVRQLALQNLDEIWVIARRAERLEALQREVPARLRILAYDLTKDGSVASVKALLEAYHPQVKLLVNAAGFGKFGSCQQLLEQDLRDMMALNMEAVVCLSKVVLPYMPRGGRIINMASMAAFQPLPYFSLYAATKAFVLSYSRALHVELKPRNISVTAVCPGFVDTEFIQVARRTKRPDGCTHYWPLYRPQEVVRRALIDSYRRRDISVYGLNTNIKRFLAKISPQPLTNAVWMWLRNR